MTEFVEAAARSLLCARVRGARLPGGRLPGGRLPRSGARGGRWARTLLGLARRRVNPGRLAAVLFGLGLLACSVSHFDGQTYRHGDVGFRLAEVPHGWRTIDISTAALAFRDDDRAATIAINGRCGKDADDVPLRSLTQHLFLQFTERKLEEQELMPLDGREALRTRMVAKLDGVPKHFDVVVLKKNGCVYDFWQIAGRRLDPHNFLHFVQGFSTLS